MIEGRFVGAAVIARLHTDPKFLADVEAAKKELATIRAKEGLKPRRYNKSETEALVR